MTAKTFDEMKVPASRSAADDYIKGVKVNVETGAPPEPDAPAGPIAARIEDDDDEPAPVRSKMVEKTRKVTGELPDTLHKKLKRGLVDREDLTINDVIVKAVERYIRNW